MTIRWFHLWTLGLVAVLFASACATASAAGERQASPKRRAAKRNAPLITAALLLDESAALHPVLLWSRDDKGDPQTHWVVGNRHSTAVLTAVPGIFVADDGHLVEIAQQHARIPVKTCPVKTSDDTAPKTDGTDDRHAAGDVTPPLADITSPNWAVVSWPEHIHHRPDAPAPTSLAPLPFDPTGHTPYAALAYRATVTATFGPLALVSVRGFLRPCHSDAIQNLDTTLLVHAGTGHATPLFTDAELEHLARNEQMTAFGAIPRRDGFPRSPLDLSLHAAEPFYLPGLGFALRYEYATSPYIYGDGAQRSQRFAAVDATFIPEVLLPWIAAPEALRPLLLPPHITIGGWAHAPVQSEAFARIFHAPPSTPAPDTPVEGDALTDEAPAGDEAPDAPEPL
ncbi:MAG: hypothetical protein M0R76_12000 [Proteobacteria bacterium]|nr:hypothetical protein [Pseudomonadota bacterium]